MTKVTSIENGSGEIDWLAKTGYGSRLKSDDISVDPAQDRECSNDLVRGVCGQNSSIESQCDSVNFVDSETGHLTGSWE